MKKRTLITYFIMGILFSSIVCGCKKENNSSPSTPGFSWQYENSSYKSNLDTAFASPGSVRSYIIIGGTGLTLSNYVIGPRFDLNSLSVGNYSIANNVLDGNVIMNYTNITGEIFDAIGGSLNITSNSSNRISGNFSATLFDGVGTSQITGTFSEVPIGN